MSEKMIAQQPAGFVRQRKPADETALNSLGPPWWQIRCCRGQEKRMMREAGGHIGKSN